MHQLSVQIKTLFSLIRLWPLMLIVFCHKCRKSEGYLLWQHDLAAFGETSTIRLLALQPQYRMLLYHRFRLNPTIAQTLFGRYPLTISTPHIGGGVRMDHPFCSILHAESIGSNLWVMNGVTIGQNHGKLPIIGNNVFCGVGSCILGGITVGDNVRIGANACIIKNVPSNCTVVGNPAVIIMKDGQKIDSYELAPNTANVAMSVPVGQWHALESLESGSVIFEAKDGVYEPLSEDDILNI